MAMAFYLALEETFCAELLHALFCTAAGDVMQRTMLKLSIPKSLEDKLPLMISLLYLATGDYGSLIRHLRIIL